MAADRILVWYLDSGNASISDGPTFIADQDYTPTILRIHTKRAPDAGDLQVDIRDDGVSIFSTLLPTLNVGTESEDVMQDFLPRTIDIAKYSFITLHLTAQGASGITVQLELVATQNSEVAESDT